MQIPIHCLFAFASASQFHIYLPWVNQEKALIGASSIPEPAAAVSPSHHDRVMARLAGYWYIVGMISSFVIWARLVTRIQHRASPAQHTTATHHSSLWKYNLYRICSPCCPYIWWPVSPSLVTAHYSSSKPQPRILKFVCTGILQHKPVTSSYFPAAQTRWQVHFRC